VKADCWAAIAHTFADAGCRVVFGLPSDEPGLLDAAHAGGRLDVRVVGDQRVAACAAAGYALITAEPVVLALNSGPGFAAAMPGLLEAASLGVPLIVVTTRVPGRNIGRGAFQHLDQQGMVESLVRWRFLVETADRVGWAVRRAVSLAVNGRPGVTVLEIADEIIEEEVDLVDERPVRRLRTVPAEADLAHAAEVLRSAKRPLIVVGGGARGIDVELGAFAELVNAPVFTTASGRGRFDERHARAFGVVGLYATPPAETLLSTADAVLVLGSRLEETARMRWELPGEARIVQVDQDPAAFGEGVRVDVALLGDVGLTLSALLDRLRGQVAEADPDWRAHQDDVAAGQSRWIETDFARSPVRAAMAAASRVFGEDVVLVQDNGLHDIWSYQYPVLTVGPRTRVVCPGEQTMMGFGLAAAVGSAIADPGRRSLVLCGDSAFRFSVGALATLRAHSLGVVVVVFDNAGYGWPRHLRAGAAVSDGLTRVGPPLDVTAIAAAFGGWGRDVLSAEQLEPALEAAKSAADRGSFAVLRVPVPDSDVPIGVSLMDTAVAE
jgi:acetolactate synthase-1/2/3 large subunit